MDNGSTSGQRRYSRRPLNRINSLRVLSTSAATALVPPVQNDPLRSVVPTVSSKHFSDKRFQDAPISHASKAALKHEFLSDVQAATFDLALSGKDLLVQARTGTGKTIAFLLPSIERLLQHKVPLKGISILIIAPTRELALQIEEEATTLLKHHPFKVQHAIGGTNPTSEAKRLTGHCDILIATPGRLHDHLKTSNLGGKFENIKTVIYDEADRLLDQGFKRELDGIMSYLPKGRDRQALLFSATVSPEIKKIATAALRPGYSFVSTLLEDEVNTHDHVEQSYIIAPQIEFLTVALSVLREDQANHLPSPGSSLSNSDSKVIVFFPTARQVAFAHEVFRRIPGLAKLSEIHSRKSQPARIKAANEFKDAKSGILLSSDVSARGMDFPGVTAVIQVGIPSDGEQYIHRLGRTARAGAAGRGVLILSQPETFFLHDRNIVGLPLKLHATLPPAPNATELAPILADIDQEIKAQAYRAWLGFYKAHLRGLRWRPEELVKQGHIYAIGALGWPADGPAPSLEAQTVGKMGLREVRHLLNVMPSQPRAPRAPRGSGKSRGGG